MKNSVILEEIRKRIVMFDGGTGSLLQAAGLKPGELPETWNIKHPGIVTRLHVDYLNAGSDMIKTNTFGANSLKYNKDAEFDLPEIVHAAVANAKAAVEAAGHGWVALDMGPTGKLLKPMGDLPFEDAVSMYAEVVREGVKAGADLILVETMTDLYELKAAVLAAKENSDLPVFATVVFDESGKMLTGGTPESAVAVLEGLGIDALGINCSLGPVQMLPMVKKLIEYASVPVIVNPNAGLPRTEGDRTVYDISPEEFAATMKQILDLGASVVGGCCGTTPEYMRQVHQFAEGRRAPVIHPKEHSLVTSFAGALDIGATRPVLIGERLNPTGKKKLKEALLAHDMEYVLGMALSQQDKGAHALDVNVGIPGVDEKTMMVDVIKELQAVTDLPLEIDTSNTTAMEAALRVYNGKALVNSVNGKQENMDAVFPLVQKYGGVVVALLLDEGGIPATADGRIRVAKKIIAEAAKYGIGKKDLLLDCLCMTVSSDPQSAKVTLETIRRVHEELGCNTVLGVSNISFGLPQRENVTTAFFTMAMEAGLDAGIINVNSESMMRSWYSYRVLNALDENCMDYITVFGAEEAAKKAAAEAAREAARAAAENRNRASAGTGTEGGAGNAAENAAGDAGSRLYEKLKLSVRKGLKEAATKDAKALLVTEDALDVINESMIPALNEVGEEFEKGTLFLPQLLMSAEAAKAAFAVIKDAMSGSGAVTEKKGRIILATVKGDIHDIGKNIVKVLLENYSYEVFDLGRDVPPEKILETVREEHVPVVGLSALMTTTVASMADTIELLRREAPEVKIMVGGAVLTKEYADKIGADAYCKDAMASVRFADAVFAGRKQA
ncbi:MAG: homocysteine S-methyltransferase family protein [Eubacterium sp.]|nr:homocysteine S-methyltransferase family protein [Eubacterium sp.]